MIADSPLIPAPSPFHRSLVQKHAPWMRQRLGRAPIRGMFLFTLASDGGGSVDFRPNLDVLGLMALGLAEEVATSIWHLVATYDIESMMLALVVDRSEAKEDFSFVRVSH